uniref:Fibrosin n=1 Tax=Nothobranchius furzeri TaxID=105023 RepID=A0A8C6LSM5_NOTFU
MFGHKDPPPNTVGGLSTPNHLDAAIEAFLGSAPSPGQGPHSFTWDPWREFSVQQQHRRDALAIRSDPHLALRSDPHLARLFQQRQMMEAERAAAVAAAAAAAAPQHPPTSTSAGPSAAVRPDFGLIPFDRHPHLGPPGGSLIDEERAQILREDFERARYFGMHPHLPHGPHLSSPSHHHGGLYSRLGPINPHHMPNGILSKTTAELVGALSVGAPPPLIPSITSRSSTPPRSSRLGRPGELALYSTHKDGESR